MIHIFLSFFMFSGQEKKLAKREKVGDEKKKERKRESERTERTVIQF